tara:strand:+ start:1302 stop:2291 length:990 start_codon:yes stop_codon:yes gene_type:complete
MNYSKYKEVFEIPEINVLFSSTAMIKDEKNIHLIPRNKSLLSDTIGYINNKANPYTLFLWQYRTLDDLSWEQLKPQINRILGEVTDLNIVICCNDIKTLNNMPKEYGSRFSGILCNHNATVSRKIFNIQSCDKMWDSVYTARMCEFKRHHLSYNLSNILYLTSGNKKGQSNPYTKKGHMLLMANQNNNFTLYHKSVPKKQVNYLLNRSRVGLCLSSKEGAMYSSIEYLLCGLPIVSTKSTGGRDVFFTNENCIIAEDTPESVAECVQKWLLNYPTLEQRQRIRQDAVSTQKQHTKILKNKLKEISSVDIDIDKLYKEKFVHKWSYWGKY